MGRVTANRLATLLVILTLLIGLSLAVDPIFGRPNVACMIPQSGLLDLLPPGCP